MRLDKYLADSGLGTRKEVKDLIKAGKIRVNNEIAKDPGMKVSESDSVFCGEEKITATGFVYIVLNKPKGCITTVSDEHGDRTVMDVLKDAGLDPVPKDLAPVGRLDKDTTGLLLLTNDGAYAHELISPKKHVAKLYHVSVDTPLNYSDIETFKNGIELSDFTCQSAELTILSDHEAEVTIYEGKFHQVKRMFKACGHTVLELKRLKFGDYELPEDLKEGDFMYVTGGRFL